MAFIGVTERGGTPIHLNVDHIAVIRPEKDGQGTTMRMAFDVSAGIHVSESYQYVMEHILGKEEQHG